MPVTAGHELRSTSGTRTLAVRLEPTLAVGLVVRVSTQLRSLREPRRALVVSKSKPRAGKIFATGERG
jgi:hypothetical protein